MCGHFIFSDKTIKASVQRVIKIWEERRLFEGDYLEALRGKLGMAFWIFGRFMTFDENAVVFGNELQHQTIPIIITICEFLIDTRPSVK